MKPTRVLQAAILAALIASTAGAGNSEMEAPLPTSNTWSVGKSGLSFWLGRGDTATGTRVWFFDEDGENLLSDQVDYDDEDWSAGLRYSLPLSENFNLEFGGTYMKRSSEPGETFVAFGADDDAFGDELNHELTIFTDEQDQKEWALSVGGIYTLAADADSPIRGSLGGSLEYKQSNTEWDVSYNDSHLVAGTDLLVDQNIDLYDASSLTAKVVLTADIHLVRDVLRVTPMVGYYYRFTSLDANAEARFWRASEFCDQNWLILDRTEDHVTECESDDEGNPRVLEGDDSTHGGGALYGLELGYRPGGVDGKFEVVLSPYFRTQIRQLAVGKQFREHRDGISLMFRMYL